MSCGGHSHVPIVLGARGTQGETTWAPPRPSRPRHQLTSEEWEELKPVIEQKYIREGQTYQEVADYLEAVYNFRPTSKQFTSKLTKWELKKNYSRAERQRLLQPFSSSNIPLDGDNIVDPYGRQVNINRVRRWNKEDARQRKLQVPKVQAAFERSNTALSDKGSPIDTDDSSSTMRIDTPDSVPPASPERTVWIRAAQDGDFEPLTKHDWMTLDVLNSPRLTRLLAGLSAEARDVPDDLEPLDISLVERPRGANSSNTRTDTVCLSDIIITPSSGDPMTIRIEHGSHELICEDTSTSTIHLVRKCVSSPRSLDSVSAIFRPLGQDAIPATGELISRPPSPFNEVYCFPPPRSPRPVLISPATLAESRSAMQKELSGKLTSMQLGGFNESHPRVLNLMITLADVAYDSGKMAEATRLYDKVISSQPSDLMTSPEKILHAQAALIDGLCRGGHPLEAKEKLERIAPIMAKRFDPTHVISRRLQKARIEIFNWMEDWEKEEPVTRDLTQICLVHLGARDPETLNALFRLASVMMGQGKYQESEQLHRLTIQLCQEGTEKHQERRCWSFTSLGRVYENQGRLEEAIATIRASAQQAKQTLGDENEAVMISDYRLGRMLARAGYLQESEELLLSTYQRQAKVLGGNHINPICTMFELGYTLRQAKKYEEATYWAERAFHKSLALSNFEFITRFCTGLGACYEDQGKYREALGFYNEALVFFRDAKEMSTDDLFNVEPFVEKIGDLVRKAKQALEEANEFSIEEQHPVKGL